MYVYVCICTHMYAYVHICMHMYVYVLIIMYMYVYICTYIYVRICMHMYVYVRICTYVITSRYTYSFIINIPTYTWVHTILNTLVECPYKSSVWSTTENRKRRRDQKMIHCEGSKPLLRSVASLCWITYSYLSVCTSFWSRGGPRPSMTSTCKRSRLTEFAQYKTVCSWSLLLLYIQCCRQGPVGGRNTAGCL